MNVGKFWGLIDEARADGGWEEMYSPLVNALSDLELGDLMLWKQIFDEYHLLSYKNKLWAAAYVINGGCSDDGFDYFRAWLIAQGKEVFLNALRDPDSLAGVENCEEDVEFEDMLSAAAYGYFEKTLDSDKDYDKFYAELNRYPLPDAIKDEINAEIAYAPDIDVDWDDEDEEAMQSLLPKLCKAFDW
jgi:hypothetical protein